MSSSLRRLLALSAAAVLLAACSTDRTNNCPAVSSLVETSVASVFRSGAVTDPSNLLYRVEITSTSSSCDADKQSTSADTSLDISFRATRDPGGGAAQYSVPYFVAVSQGDRILVKRLFRVTFAFEAGQTTSTFTDSVKSVSVTAAKDKRTFDYGILVGLQLSKAQLDYNRTSGRLAP